MKSCISTVVAATIFSYREFSWQPATEDPWLYQSPGWMFDKLTGVMVMQNGGYRLIQPEFRFDLSVQWDVVTKSLPMLQNELTGFAFGALGIVALARWLWRNNIGGRAGAEPLGSEAFAARRSGLPARLRTPLRSRAARQRG